MIIARENDVPAVYMEEPFRRSLKVLLSPAITPELKSIAAGLTLLPPGGSSDFTNHIEGEMFYVISGKGHIIVGDEEEDLVPGTAVWVPAGIDHQLVNSCNDYLKILWVLSPPGREVKLLKK
jgi:uncharacterized cupin superfamily protein